MDLFYTRKVNLDFRTGLSFHRIQRIIELSKIFALNQINVTLRCIKFWNSQLLLARCLGMMPLTKDEKTGTMLKFELCSWVTWYTFIPFVSLTLESYIAVEKRTVGIWKTKWKERRPSFILPRSSEADCLPSSLLLGMANISKNLLLLVGKELTLFCI